MVLPVRNGEETLAQAVGSCLGQTMSDLELLLVVNGCTDRSEDIAKGFAREDRRVTVLKSARGLGVTGAMEAGLQKVTTPLVARMDADDIAHPERLARQFEMLSRNPLLDAVSCGVQMIDSQGEGMNRYVEWVNGLGTPEAVARERFIECPIIQPSLLMRIGSVQRAGGYRQVDWAEDHDLFLRMLESGAQFGKVSEVLLAWRDSEGRLTRSDPAYGEDRVWEMKAHYLARLPSVKTQGVAICGAGPIGKRLARLLTAQQVDVHGFFEVNVRKIGSTIGGVPVAGPDEFGTRWREAVLLSAVGVEGGRERVRELARSAGYAEGENFWCCC